MAVKGLKHYSFHQWVPLFRVLEKQTDEAYYNRKRINGHALKKIAPIFLNVHSHLYTHIQRLVVKRRAGLHYES